MKELSIEEKAKAYDKMLARVANCSTDKYGCLIGVKPFDLFPELGESEDERIRKEIAEYFRWNTQQLLNNFNNKEVLAWLEKQGEQKPVDDTENVDNLHQYLYGTLTEFEQCLKSGTNIYVEQGRRMEDWDAREDAKELLLIARKEIPVE